MFRSKSADGLWRKGACYSLQNVSLIVGRQTFVSSITKRETRDDRRLCCCSRIGTPLTVSLVLVPHCFVPRHPSPSRTSSAPRTGTPDHRLVRHWPRSACRTRYGCSRQGRRLIPEIRRTSCCGHTSRSTARHSHRHTHRPGHHLLPSSTPPPARRVTSPRPEWVRSGSM